MSSPFPRSIVFDSLFDESYTSLISTCFEETMCLQEKAMMRNETTRRLETVWLNYMTHSLTRSIGPCVAPTISVFNRAQARIAGTSEPQRQFWWCASPRKIQQQQQQQTIHHHHDHKTIISHHSHCQASLCSLTQLSTLTQLTRTDTLALLSNTPTLTL